MATDPPRQTLPALAAKGSIKSLSNASLSLVEKLSCLSAYDEASTPYPNATFEPLTSCYHFLF